jgi:two-component system nitrogen regulation response regulator GlnG
MSAHLLLLEDDESLRRVLSRALTSAGYQVRATASAETALNWVRDGQGELLLADVLLDGTNFLENLGLVHRLRPQMPVIVMSAQATASTAIDAEKGGVYDYLPKPFDLDVMLASIDSALRASGGFAHRPSRAEPSGLIGKSAAMQSTFRAIARAATSQAHVIISGEPGSGKRQAADALLKAGGLDGTELAVITSSHSVEAVFASTQDGKPVLWLRVDEWTPDQQRAARDGLDAGAGRVIATLTPNPKRPMDRRLQTRLSECVVEVPPLRDRVEDIPELSQAFLSEFAKRDGQSATALSADVVVYLQSAAWPGNLVELRTVLSRLSLDVRGREASRDDLMRVLGQSDADQAAELETHALGLAAIALAEPSARTRAVDAVDRALISQALARAGGNRSKAAAMLGLNRNTLARRLSELDDSN